MKIRSQKGIFINCLEIEVSTVISNYLKKGYELVSVTRKSYMTDKNEYEVFMNKSEDETNE